MNLQKTLSNLKKRGFKTRFVNSSAEALELICALIPPDDAIGFGGSRTVDDLNLPLILAARGNRVYHRGYLKSVNSDEVISRGLTADWFISSTNAITEDGELVNTDGRGNRIAGQIIAGKNTLIVCGVNKLVADLPAAFERIRTVAAPLNCKRFGKTTPCVTGGSCTIAAQTTPSARQPLYSTTRIRAKSIT